MTPDGKKDRLAKAKGRTGDAETFRIDDWPKVPDGRAAEWEDEWRELSAAVRVVSPSLSLVSKWARITEG